MGKSKAINIYVKFNGYMCGDCVSEAEDEWEEWIQNIPPVREMKIKMAQKLVRQAVETYAEEARGNGMSVSDYFDLKKAMESIDELVSKFTEGERV